MVVEERASDGSGRIDLSLPAQPILLQLVRLTAGVVAARADLELNDVEDLRLAVDELCLSLMGPSGAPGRLTLRYQWEEDLVEVFCTLVDDEGGDGGRQSGAQVLGQAEYVRQELSSQILDALVDEHGESTTDGNAHAWLRMRRNGPEDS
jgi:serine/threonine-protein kinase RsbW